MRVSEPVVPSAQAARAGPLLKSAVNDAAGEAVRSTYVVFPDVQAGAGTNSAFDRRVPEHDGVVHRLEAAAVHAAFSNSPIVQVLHALALLGVTVAAPASGTRTLWICCAALVWVVWAGIPEICNRWTAGETGLRHSRRAYIAGSALAMISIAVVCWLPALQNGSAPRWVISTLIMGVALVGAAALAPLREAASVAAVLPMSPALADAAQAPTLLAAFVAVMPGLACCALALALTVQQRGIWLRMARAGFAREAQVHRLRAERDAALRADQDKSRFLAVASHDLRQPVHALGLFAATLEKRLASTPEEPLVRNVMRSIDGLDRSFNAMLDISRLDAGTVEPSVQHFPLRDLFRRLHMQFAGQAELRGLSLRFSPGGKSVGSDPQLMERILGNLIQNAIKYTEHGGIVVVTRTTRTHINVEVWDTGVGISPADLPRVFDEFFQVARGDRSRSQGLGMGLAIVKRLAHLLGHHLTVSSQVGRGTMFRLGIALGGLAEIQEAAIGADTLPMPFTQMRTILIVDDEEAICEGLGTLLEEWGYLTVTAASAYQASEAARSLGAPPDLILSDLHLGDGADGIEAISLIRHQIGREVPAILITGDTSPQELRRATDSGHPVLFKPVMPRKLLSALRSLIS